MSISKRNFGGIGGEVEGVGVSQDTVWSFGWLSISFETCVSFAYWLEAFTLVALFPYMLNIIDLLKPENIIKRLAVGITKDKILTPKEDPIQPIMDIIYGSAIKYDLETVRVGLNIATDRAIKITDSYGEKEISKCFCDHFERVGRLTVSNTDEESTIEVIKNLYDFWELTVEKGLDGAIKRVTWSLGRVGITAAEKRLRNATSRAARFLGRIGTITAEKGLEDATSRATQSLERVGNIAAEKGLGYATSRAVRSLKRIGKTAAEKRLKRVALRAVLSLEVVGTTAAAAEKELEEVVWQAACSLGVIGTAAVEEGLKDAAKQAAESLAELTISSEEITKNAIQNYESQLEKQDRNSFQKFMLVYKQELEKLRAKKSE